MFSLTCLALALLTQSTPSEAQIDRFLQGQFAKANTPGMSVAVVRQGRLVYGKGFGLADLQNEVRASADTVYRIGSVTKQFTATMVMQLVGEGKLSLDDPMRKHIPDLPEAWDKVTVRNLLNHTSGIPNYTALPNVMEDAVRKPVTPRGIVATVEKMPLDFDPGAKWSYSNTAYEVLGLILEKLDGRPYAESLQRRILDPLAMKDTYFTSNSEVVKRRAQGYTERSGKVLNADFIDMSWPYAAGSIESSVADLAKWDAALYGDKILPQATLKTMWTRTKLSTGALRDYGFGWGLKEVNSTEIVEHNGGIHGFISNIRRAPSKGLTVIVLTNSDHSDCDGVAARLMGFMDSSLAVKPPKAIEDKDPQTTAFAKGTFESILAGKLDRSKLGPELGKMLKPEFLDDARRQLGAMGSLNRFELIESSDEGGVKRRVYGLTLGETNLKLVMVIGKSGLIESLGIQP